MAFAQILQLFWLMSQWIIFKDIINCKFTIRTNQEIVVLMNFEKDFIDTEVKVYL